MTDESDDRARRLETAEAALARAHRAALDANGAALRLGLEEARDALGADRAAAPGFEAAAAAVREALAEFAEGRLADMEVRLEAARRALPVPGAA